MISSPSPAPSSVSGDVGSALATALTTARVTRRADDHWALAYINILRVQSLLEAFDDDGTGFVSVKEANMFTTSRPRDWRFVVTDLGIHQGLSFSDIDKAYPIGWHIGPQVGTIDSMEILSRVHHILSHRMAFYSLAVPR